MISSLHIILQCSYAPSNTLGLFWDVSIDSNACHIYILCGTINKGTALLMVKQLNKWQTSVRIQTFAVWFGLYVNTSSLSFFFRFSSSTVTSYSICFASRRLSAPYRETTRRILISLKILQTM
jgi:hypothetical protein